MFKNYDYKYYEFVQKFLFNSIMSKNYICFKFPDNKCNDNYRYI